MRVLWLTNIAAPYRLPVWLRLGHDHDLRIGLLESNKALISDSTANRGEDWLHRGSDYIRYQEIPTIKVKRGESRYYILRSLSSIFQVKNRDVILFGGWESPAYWAFLLAAVVFRVGRVGFYESPISTMRHTRGPVAWVRTKFFKSMHVVVAPGAAAREALSSIGVNPENIVVGFNAVDVESFHRASSMRSTEIPANEDSGHVFLYVGQLIERKRVASIIQAYNEIANPNDRLCIIGSGDQEPVLRRLARHSDSGISFIPYVSNSSLPEIMSGCMTLVLASSREVWGLVVNEALAAGMHAVVTSNCGVAPSVKAMMGVFVAQPSLSDLAAQMQASREAWNGPIQVPEILTHTPERFAEVFDTALHRAAGYRPRYTDSSAPSKASPSLPERG